MSRPTIQQRLTVVKHLASGHTLEFVERAVPDLTAEQIRVTASSHGYPDQAKLTKAVGILTEQAGDPGELPASPHGPIPIGPRRPEQTEALPNVRAASRPDETPDGSPETPPGAKTDIEEEMSRSRPLTKPDEIRILLNTAKQSDKKRIQSRADRIFNDLDRLRELVKVDQERTEARRRQRERKEAERREREAARERALQEVRRLEEQLRDARARARSGKPPTSTPAEQSGPGAAAARRRELCDQILKRHGATLDDVRAWARAAGYKVAGRGMPAAAVLKKYDAAHTTAAAGSAA